MYFKVELTRSEDGTSCNWHGNFVFKDREEANAEARFYDHYFDFEEDDIPKDTSRFWRAKVVTYTFLPEGHVIKLVGGNSNSRVKAYYPPRIPVITSKERVQEYLKKIA